MSRTTLPAASSRWTTNPAPAEPQLRANRPCPCARIDRATNATTHFRIRLQGSSEAAERRPADPVRLEPAVRWLPESQTSRYRFRLLALLPQRSTLGEAAPASPVVQLSTVRALAEGTTTDP